MLTCITCSKQRIEDGEDASPRGTPSCTKDAVKSLSTQIKDMALKVSGAYKCKAGQTDDDFKTVQRSYSGFDCVQRGSSNVMSTGGYRAARPDSNFADQRTPVGPDSVGVQPGEVMLEHTSEPKEWMAQVEPGVQITFMSLPNGGNDLKRIRFSREMFNKWQAQRWWGENYDRVMELYNVQKFNQQDLNTPGRSEDGRGSTYSQLGSARESPRMTPSMNKEWTPRYKPYYNGGSSTCQTGGPKGAMSPMEASRATTSSRDEASVSISNASEIDSEWIEEDQPGVYITIRQLVDGTRELRRVRFSREKFGEVRAKQWWEANKDRIQAQYLC